MTEAPVVVYGFDPLCGWCFGFGPAFAQVRAALAGEVEFVLGVGGLVVGGRRRPLRDDAAYLRAGLQRVRAATGVRHGPAFEALLDRGTWVSDSEGVGRALWVARGLAGDGPAIDLGAALSRAFYADGREPDDPDVLAEVATARGLDGDELVRRWSTRAARRGTAEWFARCRGAGLTTYPSLLVPRPDGTWSPLLEGVAPVPDVVARIRAVVGTAPTSAR